MKTKTVMTLFFIFCISAVTYAQKVVIANSPEGNSYAAISAEGMLSGYETRDPAKMYYKAPLYQYMSDASSPVVPITDSDGNQMYENRIVRHKQSGASYYLNSSGNWVTSNYNPNINISELFAVSPVDVYSDGAATSGNGNSRIMNWATASGFIITGNEIDIMYQASATPMGCSQYRGKAGTDQIGSWRLPTQREMMMISIFKKALVASVSAGTQFKPFSGQYYKCATEASQHGNWEIDMSGSRVYSNTTKPTQYPIRCVRDLVPAP